jgi:hypothetical protein
MSIKIYSDNDEYYTNLNTSALISDSAEKKIFEKLIVKKLVKKIPCILRNPKVIFLARRIKFSTHKWSLLFTFTN